MPGEGEGPSLPSSFQMPPVSRPSSVKRGSLLDILNGVASASSSVFPAEPSGMISGSGTQDEAPPLFPLVFPVSSERPRSRVANGGKHAAHRRRTASEASPPPGYACRLCNEQWTCVPRLTSMIGPPPVPDIKVPASPPIAIEPQVALSNARSQISRARPTEEQLLALGVPCDLVNPYRCCEQVFVNFYDATSHVAGHSEAACAKDKPYSCIYPSCEYRSFQPVHIAQHFLSDVHFGAKVACPGCGLQFARPATMLHHLSQIKKRDGSLEQHFAH
ncbi:hypothetical protein PUNSTDRAFT_122763 [Punctularia strigosozonata HHB-11173 SS5]|uniref:C2H2-type domain-containing protein n=1 Tax=Punctularia strigosozonata (strain HHB-11173) TaxID=741275 RepID=R7S3I6_PUNST|nr:uncharacterized protein PUNSTDRAFT_122763 [Punctularia strigosozonata HHB-11173 SS5]EIN04758.1 hypothetical protein PUNSTDRAFT_122763 [Punctularia strigosozonata HHB-11173 SS5]